MQEREKFESQLRDARSASTDGDTELQAENAKLSFANENVESELAEKTIELEQKEDQIIKLKEEMGSNRELMEEWRIQLDVEEKRADQATEQLQTARQLLRQSGIKLPEDGETGDEDPVAAMHRAKEEKWKSEEQELRVGGGCNDCNDLSKKYA